MPDIVPIDITLSCASFRKISDFLERIKKDPNEMGFRLRYILGDTDVNQITVCDLVDALLKTKKPYISAESQLKADGTDWNVTENNLLGLLGQAYEANLYSKSSKPIQLGLKKLIVEAHDDEEFSPEGEDNGLSFTSQNNGIYEHEYLKSQAYNPTTRYLNPHKPADYLVTQPEVLFQLGISKDDIEYLKLRARVKGVAEVPFDNVDDPIPKETLLRVIGVPEAKKGLNLLCKLAEQHKERLREHQLFVGFQSLWNRFYQSIYSAVPPDKEAQQKANKRLEILCTYGQDLLINDAFFSSAFQKNHLDWILSNITTHPGDPNFIGALNFLHDNKLSLGRLIEDTGAVDKKLDPICELLKDSQFTKICAFLYEGKINPELDVNESKWLNQLLSPTINEPLHENFVDITESIPFFLQLSNLTAQLDRSVEYEYGNAAVTVIRSLLNLIDKPKEKCKPVLILLPLGSAKAKLLNEFIQENELSKKVYIFSFKPLSADGTPASVATLDTVLQQIDDFLELYFATDEYGKGDVPDIIDYVQTHHPKLDCQQNYLHQRIAESLANRTKTIKVAPLLADMSQNISDLAMNMPPGDWHEGLSKIKKIATTEDSLVQSDNDETNQISSIGLLQFKVKHVV